MTLSNSELEVEIYYLTEEEGGRKTPIMNGYRGQFYYNGRDWDASQKFINKEICYPGETVNTSLQTLSPIFHIGQFVIGQSFEIREGARIVGKGKITNILREDFNYWDYEKLFKILPPNCKPYDKENLEGFIVDFDYYLGSIKEIKKLNFEIDLSNSNNMINVGCILKDKNIKPRPLIDKICESWQKELSFKNGFYKIYLESISNTSDFEFKLSFATWHSLYLTGKIELKTI